MRQSPPNLAARRIDLHHAHYLTRGRRLLCPHRSLTRLLGIVQHAGVRQQPRPVVR